MEGADNSYVGAVLQAVREAYPHEACGLLIGRDGVVSHAIPVANRASDPRRSYRIAADDLLAAHLAARERGDTIVGVFHSHPDGQPELSATDMQAAHPGWIYMVVATRGREPSGLSVTAL